MVLLIDLHLIIMIWYMTSVGKGVGVASAGGGWRAGVAWDALVNLTSSSSLSSWSP